MPETYFVIGSGVDADYSTLETFILGTASGIRLDDPHVPYVGLLQDHVHEYGALTVCFSGVGTSYESDWCDEDHYYIFRPQNKLWQGEEDTTDCAILRPDGTTDTYFWPAHSRSYNLVFEGEEADPSNTSSINYFYGYELIARGCLFKDFHFANSSDKSRSLEIMNDRSAIYPNQVHNCVYNNVSVSGFDGSTILNTAVFVRNSVFKNIVSHWTHPVSGSMGLSNIYNSLFDTDIQISALYSVKNCAFTGSGLVLGDMSASAAYYDTTGHYISGTYLTADTALGKGSGVYPDANPGAINNLEYWPYTWYDVGPMYFTRNALVLTQNDQSIVFRTK